MSSDTDLLDAVAEYVRTRGVTRCPTACAVATQASIGKADRRALRDYNEKKGSTAAGDQLAKTREGIRLAREAGNKTPGQVAQWMNLHGYKSAKGLPWSGIGLLNYLHRKSLRWK